MQADAVGGVYRPPIQTLKLIIAESGVKGLWRGTPATALRLSLGAGTYFFALDVLKPYFMNKDGSSSLGIGGAAAAGEVLVSAVQIVIIPHSIGCQVWRCAQ